MQVEPVHAEHESMNVFFLVLKYTHFGFSEFVHACHEPMHYVLGVIL
jgi:hypothetical protein